MTQLKSKTVMTINTQSTIYMGLSTMAITSVYHIIVMIAMIDITPDNVIRYRKWKQSGNADGRYEVLEE